MQSEEKQGQEVYFRGVEQKSDWLGCLPYYRYDLRKKSAF